MNKDDLIPTEALALITLKGIDYPFTHLAIDVYGPADYEEGIISLRLCLYLGQPEPDKDEYDSSVDVSWDISREAYMEYEHTWQGPTRLNYYIDLEYLVELPTTKALRQFLIKNKKNLVWSKDELLSMLSDRKT